MCPKFLQSPLVPSVAATLHMYGQLLVQLPRCYSSGVLPEWYTLSTNAELLPLKQHTGYVTRIQDNDAADSLIV
ncbi:hypothetical protein E2C01_098307 [Portunus trituberculatus]|uniref:Uncharacterized protein n=1 Tax=Portunus trituberculatus TaxID=210409 RepID=A0A5B7KCK7_PORTR|nr:hypothetical protein [Portunus trituberculatus]